MTYLLASNIEFTGTPAVTLAEVKNYLKIETTADDTFLSNLIDAVCKDVVKITGVAVVELNQRGEVWEVDNEKNIQLFYSPVKIGTSVVAELSTDNGRNWRALPATLTINTTVNSIVAFDEAVSGWVRLQYTALSQSLPPNLRVGILRYIAELYELRMDYTEGRLIKLSNDTRRLILAHQKFY